MNISALYTFPTFVTLFQTTKALSPLHSFVMVGFLGAYTAFSTSELESMNLFNLNQAKQAFI